MKDGRSKVGSRLLTILLDADALVALTLKFDSNHKKAVQIFNRLESQKRELLILNLALHEAATVISHRAGQAAALKFLDEVEKVQVFFLDKKIESLVWEEFRTQTKKGTSFTDCANLALCHKLRIEEIFSFDHFYKRNGLLRFGVDA